ncbi:unnamed protein product [Echinostoma caproni]|uniref:Uncharacterized protein n=1 Tax=Echinostoma caproni TaxID=27848 RepID=A0A183AGC8_9TREM|nr:unnamed protein product [Echinostoma caproni]
MRTQQVTLLGPRDKLQAVRWRNSSNKRNSNLVVSRNLRE